MTWRALAVAEELADRVPDAGRLKLQKLLYFCQGHHLAHFGTPLFDDPIEAWPKGPVVRDVYDHTPEAGDRVAPRSPEQATDEAALNTIGYVAKQYGPMSGRNLVDLTHTQRPWQEARDRGVRNQALSVESIQQWFLRPDDEEAEPSEPQVAEATIRAFIASHRVVDTPGATSPTPRTRRE